jgi:hypothetical protein
MKDQQYHRTGAPLSSGPKLTTQPPTIGTVHSGPEFAGHAEIKALFDLSRSHLYRLAEEGLIRTVCLRSKGKVRGRRLFDVESVRALLLSNIDTTKASNKL